MVNIIFQLKSIFSEILLCSEEEISTTKPYVDMGVDSILAIQISKLIQIKLNIEITPSELYNFISIESLAGHIRKKLHLPLQENKNSIVTNNFLAEKPSFEDKEKIAIIGIAGIFPGAKNVEEYWDNLITGKCLIQTTSRWERKEKKTFKGGFISDIDQFDAEFFNISPNEAKMMDPQQRLLLQAAWQAFEDGGLKKEDLNELSCGVFTTSLPGDYKYLLQEEEQAYNLFSFSGNAVSVNAGRISHFFNLKGPSINIDTACSSSLVCIDQALKHLQSGHCDLALVGAASIFSTPELFKLAEASNLISKEGFCFTFDKRADGFIPAEAIACLVLCRYSDAQKSGKNIYGIIEGLETNHDGFTNGLMSPNGNSQQDLITLTYKKK